MKRFWLYLTLALGIGGVFLWLAARDLPWGEAGDWLAAEDPAHLLKWGILFVIGYGISHAARVTRWYYLVRPLQEDVDPRLVHRTCVVGLTAILLLPLRLGELVRPYLLSKRTKLSMSAALGTAVVERVFDGLIVTGLLFVTLATHDGDASSEFARGAGLVSAAIFIPALLVTLLALWSQTFAVSLVRRIAGAVSPKLGDSLAELLGAFIDGFRGLIRARSLAPFVSITAVYWATNAVSMWVLGRFGFGLDLSLWEMTSVLAVVVIGIMIPAGPAGAGNFQFFMLEALALYIALEGTRAVAAGAFAATLHVLQFLIIAAPGLWIMWRDPEARHLVRLSQRARDAEEAAG